MTQSPLRRSFPAVIPFASVIALAALSACVGDSFDASQVPRITVSPVVAAPIVVISWEPAGAQLLQVYKGTVADGTAANLVWSIGGTSTNALVSGVEYGRNPPAGGMTLLAAEPLIAGQPYTVQVSRVDPNDASGSVSGTRYRYASTLTFTLPVSTTPR